MAPRPGLEPGTNGLTVGRSSHQGIYKLMISMEIPGQPQMAHPQTLRLIGPASES